ncbi:unnamed protein product [Allacma fusca]|uniref:Glycolipid transfer protein domain-containing protein n=1 Tax=Allacma fusca TaxID=39272 RepID=A0A8J2Q2L0_9HEXA|nr:unnamed protein product [Allacma fusca]
MNLGKSEDITYLLELPVFLKRFSTHSHPTYREKREFVIFGWTVQNSRASSAQGLELRCEVDAFAGEFEVNVLLKHLKLCMMDGSDKVLMDEYIEVFKQLYKFFCMLGTVFGFVGSDVKSKVQILQQHRSSESKDKYETVETMLEYEVSSGLTKSNKETNGARTLLRLHRSLIFVSQFLDKSLEINDVDGTTHICKAAYDNTLARYHPWLIKKGAHMAMYALPTKYDLFTKVCGHEVERSHVDSSVKELSLGKPTVEVESIMAGGNPETCRERLIITEELEGGNEYITTELVDREFEIRARAHVVDIYTKMKEAKVRQRKCIQTQLLQFPREFLNVQFSDFLRDIGNPEIFSDAWPELMRLAQNRRGDSTRNQQSGLPPLAPKSAQVGESGTGSEAYQLGLNQASCHIPGNSANNQRSNVPPSTPTAKQVPFKSNALKTPNQNHIFTFGSTGGPTTGVKKQPRQPRPGEALFTFSATGSPVVTHFPTVPTKPERIKVDAGNGQMIDVDLVFRGGPVDARKKIATDFRCWAKTRTAVQSRKLNPHRPPVKKNGSLNRQQKF